MRTGATRRVWTCHIRSTARSTSRFHQRPRHVRLRGGAHSGQARAAAREPGGVGGRIMISARGRSPSTAAIRPATRSSRRHARRHLRRFRGSEVGRPGRIGSASTDHADHARSRCSLARRQAHSTVTRPEGASLSGPSELARVVIDQAPDTILRMCRSRSDDPHRQRASGGGPSRSGGLRIGGRRYRHDVSQDFGTVSAERTVVTGDDGDARGYYTAPPRPLNRRPRRRDDQR